MELGVAVVGLGTMGGRYADALAAGRYAGARLDSVCDVDAQRANAAVSRFGVPAFASVDALLAEHRPGAAYIATPDRLHREAATTLARAGVPLLVEKPLATTNDDAEAIVAAAREGGAVAEVNFSNRWNPPFVQAKAAVEAGTLGEIVTVVARLNNVIASPRDRLAWSGATTPAWFLMSHSLDIAHWLHGCRAESVFAAGRKGVLTALGIDTYDFVQAIVRYENGVTGVFESTWILPESQPSPAEFDVRVIGTRGALTVNTSDQMIRVFGERIAQPSWLGWASDRFAAFVAAVRGEQLPGAPLSAGLENTRTLVALHRSLESGTVEAV